MKVTINKDTPNQQDYIVDFSLETFRSEDFKDFIDGKPRLVTSVMLGKVIENDSVTYCATAMCSPGDKFSRAKGRMIALSRAMRIAKLPRETRVELVNAIRAKGCKLWK